MNWLNRFLPANWTCVLGGLLLLMTLACGVQIGESRVRKEWDAEKQKVALVQAKQEQLVVDTTQSQRSINQEISNEFQAKQNLLAGWPIVHSGDIGLRFQPYSGGDSVSAVPTATGRVEASTANAVSDSAGTAPVMNCDLLAFDAAQTTLMVVEFQRWYQEQARVFSVSND